MIGMERATLSARIHQHRRTFERRRDISQLDGLRPRVIFMYICAYLRRRVFFVRCLCRTACVVASATMMMKNGAFRFYLFSVSFCGDFPAYQPQFCLYSFGSTHTHTLCVLSSRVSSDLVRRCLAHLTRHTPDSSERCNTHRRCSLWFH